MEQIKNALAILLLTLWASPWLLLLVDGVALFLTGMPLTSVPWNEGRVLIAMFTPFLVGFIAVGIGG